MNEAGKLLREASLADSWGGIAALFLLFLYFYLGSLGYGFLLRRAWRGSAGLLESTSDAFLFASGLLWLLATALASFQLLGTFPAWTYWLFFLPGFIAAIPLVRALAGSALSRQSFLFALFVFVFLLRGLTAALPARHGDPLLYHLLGPRLWMEAGGFTMNAQLPNALLASSWDILYLWPQMFFFSTKPLYGLVEAQLFSQWLHLFLAWAGGALLVMRLFRHSVRPRLLPLAGLAALFVSGLHWTAPLAKNDVGIAFWALGAIVYFTESLRTRSRQPALLSGVFAGLAISGKVTALLTLGPLLFGCLIAAGIWQKRRAIALTLSFWGLGLAVGALPIYLRNAVLSGNPFFPMFPEFFPSPFLAPTYEAHFAQVQPSNPLNSLSRLYTRAPELWRESPFIPVAMVLALLLAFSLLRSRRERDALSLFALLAGSIFAYTLFVVTQSPVIELRYLGASLQILAGGGVILLLREAARLRSLKLQYAAVAVLLIAILASSKLPLHVAGKIWKEPLGVNYVSTHSAGEAKAWLRKNAGSDFTVMTGDNESYYLTPVSHAVLSERADLDRGTREEKEFPSFVQKLCELSHAKYLLDARPGNGVGARFGTALPEAAVAFSAQGAKVYDLSKLESMVSPSTHGCSR